MALILLIIASLFYSGYADRTLTGSRPNNQIKYIQFEIHDVHLNATVFQGFSESQQSYDGLVM